MTSPEVTPPPDFLVPIAVLMGVFAVVFLVLSLFLIGFGAYRKVAYKEGMPDKRS